MFERLETDLYTVAIIIGLSTLLYFVYKRYFLDNKYESIEDNEILLQKLKAARKLQQDNYSNTVKLQAELKKNEDNENSSSNNKQQSDKSNKSNESYVRDYFPLMSGGNFSYRPPKKRSCGPCGGGGCG